MLVRGLVWSEAVARFSDTRDYEDLRSMNKY